MLNHFKTSSSLENFNDYVKDRGRVFGVVLEEENGTHQSADREEDHVGNPES